MSSETSLSDKGEGETVASSSNPLESVTYAGLSDIGLRRDENQDSFGILENERFKLYVVCDGMGGVKGGAVASGLAVATIKEELRDKPTLSEDIIREAVRKANAEIFKKGTSDAGLAGMGTTLVLLGFVGTKLFIASVGDSRAYRVRQGGVHQLTVDHTLVQELLRSGAITPDQAHNHPVSHMLTRSLGPTPEVEVDCWLCEDGPHRGDVYLMCSDGLYNLVGDLEVLEVVQSHPSEGAIQLLIDMANERGGTDNITVVVAEVGETFPVAAVQLNDEILDESEAITSDGADVDAEILTDGVEPEETKDSFKPAANGNGNHHVNGGMGTKENPVMSGNITFDKLSDSIKSENDGSLDSTGEAAPEAGEQEPVHAADALVDEDEGHIPEFPPRSGAGLMRFLMLIVVALVLVIGVKVWIMTENDEDGTNLAANRPPPTQSSDPKADYEAMLQQLARDRERNAASSPQVVVTPLAASVQSPAVVQPTQVVTPEVENQQVVSASDLVGLSARERDNIIKRREALLAQVAELDERVASFERPFSGKLGETLIKAQSLQEELQKRLASIQNEIEVETRKVAVWYGRGKRLETTDPVNMATEVSAVSESVREKNQAFQRATLDYLNAVDILRYNPSDTQQAKIVSELARARKDKIVELTAAVRTAIEESKDNSNSRIAELAVERDQIKEKMNGLRLSANHVRILASNDEGAKRAQKNDLLKQREVIQGELEGLNQLVESWEAAGVPQDNL